MHVFFALFIKMELEKPSPKESSQIQTLFMATNFTQNQSPPEELESCLFGRQYGSFMIFMIHFFRPANYMVCVLSYLLQKIHKTQKIQKIQNLKKIQKIQNLKKIQKIQRIP